MSTTLKLVDPSFQLSGIFRGKVVDNNDPRKLGRIKVKVYPFFNDNAISEIPWAIPAFGLFGSSGNGYGSFTIPENDTFVYIFFEMSDIYQPVYFAAAPTAQLGLPESRNTNYPNKKVFRTKSGIEISINDTIEEIKVNHPSGVYLKIDQTGNITIQGMSGSYLKIDQTGNVIIQGTSISTNPA